jgi:tetratricopeptide (TPR) repeat protein
VTSHQSLAVLYYTLGKYDQALAETDRAIEIDRRKRRDPALTAELHYNRGGILWSQGKPGTAAEEWRAALRENPKHAQARKWLGVAEGSAPPPKTGSR